MAVDSALSSPLGPPACEKDAKALRFVEEMTRNADSVQEKVLEEILARNAETEYLRRINLSGATDRETFKSRVPMIKYEDLQPEIQRIANGDRSPILLASCCNNGKVLGLDGVIQLTDSDDGEDGPVKTDLVIVIDINPIPRNLLNGDCEGNSEIVAN